MRGPLLLLGALIIVFVVVLVLARLKGGSGRTAAVDYSKRRTLFSPAERSFLGVLEQAVGDEYRVFGKIRVADVLEPRHGMSRSARQSALNRISAKPPGPSPRALRRVLRRPLERAQDPGVEDALHVAVHRLAHVPEQPALGPDRRLLG